MLNQINAQLRELEALRDSVEDTEYFEYWSMLYTKAYITKLRMTS